MKFFLILFFLNACTKPNLIDQLQKKDSLSIIFTGNINAEIEPCGCRQFPLGGIDNVYGALEEEKKNSSVLFIDTGDSFFQGTFIPKNEKQSTLAKAHTINEALNLTNLNFKILGDQDFSAGVEELKNILKKSKFQIIGSNLKDGIGIPHLKNFHFNFHDHHFFIISVTNPETLQAEYQDLFTDPIETISNQINILKKDFQFNPENAKHHLYVLSHSGTKFENRMAEKFPEIDWILGSHSMNFSQKANVIKKTKLAQMLSRNHYLGKIKYIKNKDEYDYTTFEINDELAKKLTHNPLSVFIKQKKQEIDQIQINEQNKNNAQFYGMDQIPSASTCIDCHDTQGTFWQKTAHSLAYITLHKANKSHDMECLSCHSLEAKNPKAFIDSTKIVLNSKTDDYWKEVFAEISPKKSIRELSEEKIYQFSKIWYEKDLKFNTSHNYANVQCLNCHQQDIRHLNSPTEYKSSNLGSMKQNCLNCHNNDQSNHWYKDGKLDENLFQQAYKKVSCPKSLE